jgi:hypothetical protein
MRYVSNLKGLSNHPNYHQLVKYSDFSGFVDWICSKGYHVHADEKDYPDSEFRKRSAFWPHVAISKSKTGIHLALVETGNSLGPSEKWMGRIRMGRDSRLNRLRATVSV